MTSRILSIVFTDIKGYTERTAAGDRDSALKLLAKQDELLRPVIGRYRGTVVKTIGDALLITFESPTDAVLCGLVMQHALRKHNAELPADQKIEIRVAVNTGEVNLMESDVIGDPVNVASRVEGITEPGEVWFTEATYLAMNKTEVPSSVVGEFRLKGIPESIRIFRVILDENHELVRRIVSAKEPLAAAPAPVPRKRRTLIAAAAGVVVLVALAALALVFLPDSEKSRIRAQISEGRIAPALFALDKLLEKNPNDSDLQALVRQAVEKDVVAVIATEGDTAAKALQQYLERYRFLGRLPRLQAQAEFACARQTYRSDSRAAMKMMEDLVERSPGDPDILYAVGKWWLKDTGRDTSKGIHNLHQAAVKNPAKYERDPVVLYSVQYFLEWYGPRDGWDELRSYIGKKYLADVRADLGKWLYDSEKATPRWNAKALLEAAGDPIDELRFYLAEILDPSEGLESPYMKEALEFFEKLRPPVKIPSVLTKFPLLDREIFKPDSQVLQIVSTLFLDSLKNLLAEAVVCENTERRINAYRLLQPKLKFAEIERYHAANLVHWNPRYIPPYVYESIEFFEKLPARLAANPEAARAMEKIAERTARTAEDFRKRGYDDEAKAFQRFADAANRALAPLKPR